MVRLRRATVGANKLVAKIGGRGRRAKGARGEREFFSVLNKFLPERLRLSRELAQTRDGGSDGLGSGLAIEVKRQETVRLNQWLAQARAQAQGSDIPVVAYRQNGGEWRCIVDMTPVQLAVYMRYRNNLQESEATIKAASESL